VSVSSEMHRECNG